MDTATIWFMALSKYKFHKCLTTAFLGGSKSALSRSRVNGDVHARFWSRGCYGNIKSTVTSSHPGAVGGSKGSVVRRLKWYVSWVQNVVKQFGPYLPRLRL